MATGTNFANERMQTYLAHQQQARAAHAPAHADDAYDEGAAGAGAAAPGAGAGAVVEVAPAEELDDFKNQVRLYLEIDNTLKKLKAAVKERLRARRELSARILDFMGRYHIEELNTRDGKLRYRVVNVKEPLTQSVIKERIKDKLESGEAAAAPDADVVIEQVFLRECTTKKAVLKRTSKRSARVEDA